MSNLELIRKFRASLGLPPAPHITALPSTKKLLEHTNDKFIQVILDDVPYWRRGLSLYQYSKIDKLYLYLRDDIYEGTSHRVRRGLRLIGLTKQFKSKELQHFIQLSDGDDLAFLWFLLVEKYGFPTPETITIEQQTIMTGIAHLNMLETMQALDQILPVPQKRCKDGKLDKQKAKVQKCVKNYQRMNNFKVGNDFLKPYTQSQRLPLPYGKSLILKKPPVRLSYNFNERLAAMKIEKKGQRWFASFSSYPEKLVPNEVVQTLRQLKEEPKVEDHADLCIKQYQEVKAVEKNMEKTLQSMALRNCPKRYKSEKHRQEVLADLQGEVNFEMEKFRKYSQKYRLRPLIHFMNNTADKPTRKKPCVINTIKEELNASIYNRTLENSKCKELSKLSSSEQFFMAPENYRPYKFDYQKVFTFKNRKNIEISEVIEKELQECRNLLKTDFNEKSREYMSKVPTSQKMENYCYDCNDLMLMHNMLRDALEYCAKNPKLLLPAFPDAHKLIMLREFIVSRYGKSYTLQEQKDGQFLAVRALTILDQRFKLHHLPSYKPLLNYYNKDYTELNNLKKMTDKWRHNFKDSMINQILTYTRNIWAGTRSATLDVRTRIYLTYLPTRPKDVRDLFLY